MVYQAGLGVRKRGDVPASMPLGSTYRAIVMRTMAADDPSNHRGYRVVCDVILLNTMAPLYDVPVMLTIGTNNAAIPWMPKPTTKTLSGAPLRLRALDRKGTSEGAPTSFLDMDGDVVTVEFLEGARNRPIITGCQTHQATRRRVRTGPGWDNDTQDSDRGVPYLGESYLRHSGTELRIREDGSLLVDTVGATQDTETETPAALGGEQRFRVKRGQQFVVAAGSVNGAGNAGGDELLALRQDVDGSVRVEAARGEFEMTISPLGAIVASVSGGFRYEKPAAGPATVALLGGTQPIVLGPPLASAAQAFGTALQAAVNTYALTIAAIADPTGTATSTLTAALTAATEAFATQVASSLSRLVRAE